MTTNTRKSWTRMSSGCARYSRSRTRPDATKTSPETAANTENRAKLLLKSGDIACQQTQMQQVQMQIPRIHACQHVPRLFAWARTTARGDCPVRFHLSGVSVASATQCTWQCNWKKNEPHNRLELLQHHGCTYAYHAFDVSPR